MDIKEKLNTTIATKLVYTFALIIHILAAVRNVWNSHVGVMPILSFLLFIYLGVR
jgi:hypothetical protein